MGYKKSVYLKAKKILDERRETALADAQLRWETAVLKCPGLKDVQQEISSYGAQAVKAVALGADAQKFVQGLGEKSLLAQKKRKELLVSSGFPADYLEVKYSCPVCNDTGTHDGYYCRCYVELIKETAKNELSVASKLKECTFSTFRLDYYPSVTDKTLGVSQSEHMKAVYRYCRDYAQDFSPSSGSLIMLGQTGLGKTHLSLAIANVVIDKGYGVYYGSVQTIMDRLQKEQFGKANFDESITDDLMGSDLLILDDLGTEFSTQFTVAQLYNIINTRINNNLPTIISTNLDMRAIEEKYTQRIASRIVGSSMPIQFCGRDVRQLKSG